MPSQLQIPQLSILVLARNHNPSILTPDFLKINQIVDDNWQVGSPILTPEQIYQVVSSSFDNNNFQTTFKRLLELKEEEDELEFPDDEEIYTPTEFALSGSIDLLIELYFLLGENFPLGYASVDSRGGVNLVWKNRLMDKEIRFNYPASPDGYSPSIYSREGDDSSLKLNPSIGEIADQLKGLMG